jgi:hypothetical protein
VLLGKILVGDGFLRKIRSMQAFQRPHSATYRLVVDGFAQPGFGHLWFGCGTSRTDSQR